MINLTILNLSLEKEKCKIFMAKNDFFRFNLYKVIMLRLVIRFRSEIFFDRTKPCQYKQRWIKSAIMLKVWKVKPTKKLIILKKSFLKTTKGIKSTRETFEKIADFYKKRRELDETVNNTNEKVDKI